MFKAQTVSITLTKAQGFPNHPWTHHLGIQFLSLLVSCACLLERQREGGREFPPAGSLLKCLDCLDWAAAGASDAGQISHMDGRSPALGPTTVPPRSALSGAGARNRTQIMPMWDAGALTVRPKPTPSISSLCFLTFLRCIHAVGVYP